MWWRPYLLHFFWLSFWDKYFFYPFPLLQRVVTAVFLLRTSSTSFDAREFWSVAWDLTISDWWAIWIAVSSVKCDFNCNFWYTFLLRILWQSYPVCADPDWSQNHSVQLIHKGLVRTIRPSLLGFDSFGENVLACELCSVLERNAHQPSPRSRRFWNHLPPLR